MKIQTANEALTLMATNVSGNRVGRSAAVVEDPAAAYKDAHYAENDRALPLCERAAADASHTAAVRSNCSATTFCSHPAVTWVHRIARDADNSNLVNFPFAFTAFTLVTIGLISAFWGMAVVSVWLSVVGFLLSLAGSGLYGWSVCDD